MRTPAIVSAAALSLATAVLATGGVAQAVVRGHVAPVSRHGSLRLRLRPSRHARRLRGGQRLRASISTYHIANDGSLELVDAVAASTGTGPTDATVSPDGGSLHVRMRDGSVSSFTIGSDGSLAAAGSAFVSAAFGEAGLVAD